METIGQMYDHQRNRFKHSKTKGQGEKQTTART